MSSVVCSYGDMTYSLTKKKKKKKRDDGRSMKTAGGIHAVIEDDSARLFVLGSASRGIPYRQWKIPLPATGPKQCGFCPRADVIAVVESQHVTYVRL